jgi:putative addiction module component (TIGR02574 family)
MAAPDVQELLELDLETRLALVQKLWDSIVEDARSGAQLPLAAEERELLDQRLREDDEDPAAAISWAEARARLHQEP